MTVYASKPEINVREKLKELDKPSGVAGEAMLRAETPQEQFNLIGAGRRNIIINGAMRVDQRNLGIVSVTTTPFYIVDRFSCYNAVGSMNAEQSTDAPSGFAHSFRVQCTTANASPGAAEAWIQYKPEAQDIYNLAYGNSDARSMTISFWVKSTVTGLAGFYIYQADGARAYQARYTIHNSNTWEWKSITIPGDQLGNIDDNNDAGAELRWYLAGKAGDDNTNEWGPNPSHTSSRTPSTYNFNSTVGNVFAVTGVQIELGKVATPFEHRSYGEELALCQRYYQRLGNNDGSNTHLMVGSAEASGVYVVSRSLLAAMRAVPTISLGNAVRAFTATAGVVTVSSFNTRCSRDIACISANVTGSSTIGNSAVLYGADAINSTGKYIALDAEL